MRSALALLALVVVMGSAQAGPKVGVVVIGVESLQPQLSAQIERWLKDHGHAVKASPFEPAAISTLLDCSVIEDPDCMRRVVDKRSDADGVVFARVEVDTSPTGDRTVTIKLHWFVKGQRWRTERRTCEACTDDTMSTAVGSALATLVGDSTIAMGTLRLASKPRGLRVLINGRPHGTTPLEQELPEGSHAITLLHGETTVDERTIEVKTGQTTELVVPVKLVGGGGGEPPSKILPGVVIGAGVAALAAGGVLYATSEIDDGTRPTYRDSKPHGIGVAIGGLALVASGVVVLVLRRSPAEPGPTVAVMPGEGWIGWSGRF